MTIVNDFDFDQRTSGNNAPQDYGSNNYESWIVYFNLIINTLL